MFYWTAIYRHQTAYSHKTMLNFSFLSVSETIKVLKLSLTEFSLPKFYQLFGISKVKCAAVSAFRSTYRHGDRSFAYTPPEQERLSLQSLEVITDALLEIMEVCEEVLTNSLWPNDAMWWFRTGSALAQVMACCLTAPSHNLNQCWLVIKCVLWHSPESSFHKKCLWT